MQNKVAQKKRLLGWSFGKKAKGPYALPSPQAIKLKATRQMHTHSFEQPHHDGISTTYVLENAATKGMYHVYEVLDSEEDGQLKTLLQNDEGETNLTLEDAVARLTKFQIAMTELGAKSVENSHFNSTGYFRRALVINEQLALCEDTFELRPIIDGKIQGAGRFNRETRAFLEEYKAQSILGIQKLDNHIPHIIDDTEFKDYIARLQTTRQDLQTEQAQRIILELFQGQLEVFLEQLISYKDRMAVRTKSLSETSLDDLLSYAATNFETVFKQRYYITTYKDGVENLLTIARIGYNSGNVLNDKEHYIDLCERNNFQPITEDIFNAQVSKSGLSEKLKQVEIKIMSIMMLAQLIQITRCLKAAVDQRPDLILYPKKIDDPTYQMGKKSLCKAVAYICHKSKILNFAKWAEENSIPYESIYLDELRDNWHPTLNLRQPSLFAPSSIPMLSFYKHMCEQTLEYARVIGIDEIEQNKIRTALADCSIEYGFDFDEPIARLQNIIAETAEKRAAVKTIKAPTNDAILGLR